jgi:hypothetical protein
MGVGVNPLDIGCGRRCYCRGQQHKRKREKKKRQGTGNRMTRCTLTYMDTHVINCCSFLHPPFRQCKLNRYSRRDKPRQGEGDRSTPKEREKEKGGEGLEMARNEQSQTKKRNDFAYALHKLPDNPFWNWLFLLSCYKTKGRESQPHHFFLVQQQRTSAIGLYCTD